jgi:hypothetical protein
MSGLCSRLAGDRSGRGGSLSPFAPRKAGLSRSESRLYDPGATHGAPDGFLRGGLGQRVPSLEPGARVDRSPGRGEDVLPGRLAIGVGILLGQGMRQVDSTEPRGDIPIVPAPNGIDLPHQGFHQRSGQEGHAVFLPLAVADDEVLLAEIDVLDPEAEAFHQPQPGTIKQTGHEMLLAIELGQDGADLGAREDHGQPFWPLGPAGVDASLQGSLEDDFVEEQQALIAWFWVEAATSSSTAR